VSLIQLARLSFSMCLEKGGVKKTKKKIEGASDSMNGGDKGIVHNKILAL